MQYSTIHYDTIQYNLLLAECDEIHYLFYTAPYFINCKRHCVLVLTQFVTSHALLVSVGFCSNQHKAAIDDLYGS